MDDVGPGVWDMKVDQVAGVSTKVTWENAGFWLSSEDISFSVTVNANGTIDMSYAGTGWAGLPSATAMVGISSGNSVGTGAEPPADLSTGTATSTIGLIYETIGFGSMDLAGTDLHFVPNGSGGWAQAAPACAFHKQYGTGCYQTEEAFYGDYVDSAASSAALQGKALLMIPNVNGYVVLDGTGSVTFRTPVTPNVLALTDDSEADITPSAAFQWVGGPVPTVSVNSNGTVNMAPIGSGNDVFIYGDVFALLNDPVAAFRSNRDYNPTGGSGLVSWEEDTGVLYITWSGVYIYGGTNPETFQFQLTLASGTVAIIWQAMDTVDINELVVGYAPGGGSTDFGAKTLPPAAPFTTSPDGVLPLTLSASPRPVITGGGAGPAVLCTYTVSNVPAFDPVNFPGVGACNLIFSVGAPIPGGLDLGTFPVDIGLPGCRTYISSADAFVDISNVITGGPGGTLSFSIAMPQPLFSGLEFRLQALALSPLAPPNQLVGTSYSGLTSNGLTIHYDNQ
jgi:hypothetical protein